MRKSDGVRVDHEKKINGLKVNHKKLRWGESYHKKEGWGECSP